MKQTPNAAVEAPAQSTDKTVSHVLGEIAWLLTQSPLHKQMFIGDLEWFCMPPILTENFRLYYGPGAPAAVAFWAAVTEETEKRLEGGAMRLRPDEWNAGDRLWLIELIAPFGAQDEILADLAVTTFKGKPFKFLQVTADGRRSVQVYETPVPAGTLSA